MSLSLSSVQVSMLIWFLVGLVIGLLLASLLGPARRRLSIAEARLAEARAQLEARDTRIASLERELASLRDQVRPLSDEVDRLRREQARRGVAPAVDMSGAAIAGGAIAPPVSEPFPPFLDAPRGAPDDLTLLKGVGDRFAAKLNAIGVYHYRQIADWTPEEAALADSRLDNFRGRIERDRLVEQARLLADGRTTEYEARFGRIGAAD